MTVWLSRIAALARHGLRDTMGPWLAVSLSLHAGIIVAVLPDPDNKTMVPNAGSAIAVDIVLVEGPDARAAMATGKTGDRASHPDRARKAERHGLAPAARQPVTEPVAETPPQTVPESTPPGIAPKSSPGQAAAANAPPAPAAPVILAPRPRRKPVPPPIRPAARPFPRPETPSEIAPQPAESDTDEASAGIAAISPPPASPGGGSRGASPQPGNPKPVYPYSARRQGRQGRVVLRVEVRPDGTAEAVSIERSSGDARLDEAALAAVRQWRFRPAQRNGAPVAADVRVPIRFSLR